MLIYEENRNITHITKYITLKPNSTLNLNMQDDTQVS